MKDSTTTKDTGKSPECLAKQAELNAQMALLEKGLIDLLEDKDKVNGGVKTANRLFRAKTFEVAKLLKTVRRASLDYTSCK